MLTPIEVGLKPNTIIIDVAQRAKAEYLIATTIRQDRSIPRHESMESAKLRDGLMPRSQEKVIRIAKENLDVEIAKLIRRHRLDRRLRSNRHENRRFNDPARRMQTATPRPCVGIFRDNLELHGSAIKKHKIYKKVFVLLVPSCGYSSLTQGGMPHRGPRPLSATAALRLCTDRPRWDTACESGSHWAD